MSTTFRRWLDLQQFDATPAGLLARTLRQHPDCDDLGYTGIRRHLDRHRRNLLRDRDPDSQYGEYLAILDAAHARYQAPRTPHPADAGTKGRTP